MGQSSWGQGDCPLSLLQTSLLVRLRNSVRRALCEEVVEVEI